MGRRKWSGRYYSMAADAAQKFNLISKRFHIALQIAAKRGHVPIVVRTTL